MRLSVKISVSLVVAILIGLFYAYENPDHKYYKYSSKKYYLITYESYQDLTRFNKEVAEFAPMSTTPIIRKDVLNLWRILITGSLAFVGMMLLMNLLGSIENKLKQDAQEKNS